MSEDNQPRVINEGEVQPDRRPLHNRSFEPISSGSLPFIDLDRQQLEAIACAVPGGAQNIEDIYPLSPTQEGVLFQRLMSKQGDAYVLSTAFTVASESDLSSLILSIQKVIDRHDVLRASIVWEGLPQPVQVIHRQAKLPIEQLVLDPTRDPVEQIKNSLLPENQMFVLQHAPLVRLKIAEDRDGHWYALMQLHHLACDDQSWRAVIAEVIAMLHGQEAILPTPVPYKSYVTDALSHAESKSAEEFFREKLSGIDEPVAPFGLLDVHGDGGRTIEATLTLDSSLAERIRAQARRYGVTAARLFHAGWGLVVASTGGVDDVVFGTVLLTRRQPRSSAERMVGLSINTLPIRLQLGALSARQLVELVHREIGALFSHQHASLGLIKRSSGVAAGAPLFTAIINYRHRLPDTAGQVTAATPVRVLAQRGARTNYPVTMSVDDLGDAFVLVAQTDPSVEPARVAAYLQTAMGSLIDALEHQPDAPALSLRVLPDNEHRLLIEEFNGVRSHCPQELLIHDLFEAQVTRTPHVVAVTHGAESYTYAELNARANQLARYLVGKGIGAEQLVGICLERSLDLVVAIVAVLKAGAAYVPLDPAYPDERISYMLEDAALTVLLTQSKLKEKLRIATSLVVCLDDGGFEIARQSRENGAHRPFPAHSRQAAYVIYTSGSTGKPKGVVVEHRNVTRLFSATDHWFGFGEQDVWTLFHSSAFDFSVWEIWGALLYGGRLVIVPYLTARSPQDFYKLVCDEKVTVLCQTPSAFVQFVNAQEVWNGFEHSLRFVIFGGEALELRSLQPWVKRNGAKKPALVNMYGITETTVHVTYRPPLTEEEILSSRGNCVGKPIPDLRVYVLDTHHKPAPIGVAGELYVGGAGVSRGYLNQQRLTSTRFVADPFSREPAARMYKTGDLGAWHPNGTLEYLGRNDHQVKIRGFRIELGEIEAELMRHAGIREAVVLAREDVRGEKRLIAYVVLYDKAPPSVDDIRAHLKRGLPEHMVPSAFINLDRLPLTQNGKLDRRSLPSPDISSFTAREYEAPQGELEEVLAGIWRNLLGAMRVGRHDNFFELGGHSLMILQMMDRLRRIGVMLEARQVFENPILSTLAGAIASASLPETVIPPNLIPVDATSIEPHMVPLADLNTEQLARVIQAVPGGAANIQDIYPLTPLQEGMLFHHILNEKKGDVYVIATLLFIESREKLEAMMAAMQRAVDRHDVLRTAVLWEDLPQPVQVVCRRAAVPITELSLRADDDPVEQLRAFMRPEHQRIDLRRAPLLDLQIASAASGQWYAIFRLHHIIDDATSMKRLIAEIIGDVEGRAREIAEVTSYRDHVARVLAYAKEHGAEDFFKQKLAKVDEPTAPFGLIDVHEDGTQIRDFRLELELDLALRLRVQGRRVGVSAASLFHAAWALVIAATSSKDEVVFGTVLMGRLQWAGNQHALGMFINTLPLRLELQDLTAQALIERTQRELVELLSHEQASLAAAQRCSSITGSAPLFTALLNYRHSATSLEEQWSGSTGIRMLGVQERTNFPITLLVDDRERAFTITALTDWRIEPERVIGYLHTAIRSLVHALEHAPQTLALSLSVLPEGERQRVIEIFNATQVPYRQEKLLHELFEEQVARTPKQVALVYEDVCLSYEELNGRANQLARYLLERKVKADELVGLCMERSVEMVVGLMGILKAGGAYVPLDPDYPEERLAFMITDAAPRLLLTQRRLRERLAGRAAAIIELDEQWRQIAAHDATNLNSGELGLSSRQLAYMIYTSGSTGRPKGAMNEHCALINRLQWMQNAYHLDEADRVLQKTPFSFDVSVWEFFWTLLHGSRLVIARPGGHQDPQYLRELIEAQQITRLHFVPSMLQIFLDQLQAGQCASLRQVVCSGEELQASLQTKFFDRLPQARLSNLYGPTEAAVDVTYWECSPEDRAGRVPIGRPIWNTQMYVLDRRAQPVPIGVTGELYIGGDGVGRGYHNRSEMTAQRFVCDAFGKDAATRLYKTGDLGRWRADGVIEYFGRNDFQVKIRGVRIELGEIEARLADHEAIKEALVLAREDVPGEKRLVAYVVSKDVTKTGAEELRAYLKGELPEYMVPSAFVMIDRFPLTPNGKLDRRALPAPDLDAYASRQYEPPRGHVEEILAGIWQSLLRVERVGRQDNFFELGGHSLLIVQMMERMRQLGLGVELRRVFESQSLAHLASVLTSEAVEQFEVPPNLVPSNCAVIEPSMLPLANLESEHIETIVRSVPGGAANVQDIYPLAPLQEGILFHHLLNEQEGDIYVLTSLVCVSSRARLDELIASFQAVINRHDVLRTAVLWTDLPRPMQVVIRTARLPVHEVKLDAARDPLDQVDEWLRPERQRLDLGQAPLMRLQVAEDPNNGQWYALWQLHHIVDDATSLRLVISEVAAHLEGREGQLPPPIPYRIHVAQALAYARKHDAEAFFRSKLSDVVDPTAPFGLQDAHGVGASIVEACEHVDSEIARQVREQSRRLGVSAATLFHAAWALVVSHTSGRDDVVFGSVLLGRLQGTAGAQRTLGMFINTLPLRLRLRGVTARTLVEQTQRELVELLSHEQASLAVAQRCSGVGGSAPLFTALLNYRHRVAGKESSWSSVIGVRPIAFRERTNYPVTLSVDDFGDAFTLTALTDRRIDPKRMTGYLHTAVRSLVHALQQAPQTPALSLKILPEAERQLVLESLNATQVVYERERPVHELFEHQVTRSPDAAAVMYEQQALTYAQLNCKANQLARYLRDKGVRADAVVAICLDRGLEMVIGVLGVLKAGGAYLPLDPTYPPERLQYMLQDSAPKVILTQEKLSASLKSTSAAVLALDTSLQDMEQFNAANLSANDRSNALNLAYVIYTSGSTGLPKGTAMPHGPLANLIEWHRRHERLGIPRRTLQFAALSFDVAFQEIFSTLCSGGTLVMLDEWVRKDAHALIALLKKQSIERLFVPPLILQSLVECCDSPDSQLASLRDVITAGEQLRITPEIIRLFDHLSDCQLHNHYGPTETHVVTALQLAGKPEQWPVLPPIGRPIANTRIYVLDEGMRPVPMGVAADVYIGGANLARSYLNRAQLTSERFLADSFSVDGRDRLYKTGDLGRWQGDGTLEYLGRNDGQVKIRGFRVELGELEAQLALHAEVKEAAVMMHEDARGQKRLVAYVTPCDKSRSPSAEDLRAYLKRVLPDHMVPSAFVVLAALPLTPSGKLNRRALPTPDLTAYVSREYQPPRGEIEESIAGIWQSVLGMERVGRNDNFFELGGHSLLVLSVLLKINRAFTTELRVTDVYKNPTIVELARRVVEGAADEQLVDLQQEARLPEDIVARAGVVRAPAKAILLTGATGFIGRFLIARLLEETDATIYCLVRAQSQDQAAARLRSELKKWDLWRDDFDRRVVSLAGDLREPFLGVEESTYRTLCEAIDTIYHCGASMNHLETYTMAKRVNVDAVTNLVRLAAERRPKLINYISTLGVFSSVLSKAGRVVDELSPIDAEKHLNSRGYAASKWVGEKIFFAASERGIACNVFRLGLIWADSQLGRYDELQREYRVLKSCLLSGFGIRDYLYTQVPTPVDFAARAVVCLANKHPSGGGIFHISGSDKTKEGLFERCNEFPGISLKLLPLYEWIHQMRQLHQEGRSMPVVPLIEFAFVMDEQSFAQHQLSLRSSTVRVDCRKTRVELEEAGLIVPPFDADLLAACIESMRLRDADVRNALDREIGVLRDVHARARQSARSAVW